MCMGRSLHQSHMLSSKREHAFHVKSGNAVLGEMSRSPYGSRMSFPFHRQNPCLHYTSLFGFCNILFEHRVCKPESLHTRCAHNSAMLCATVPMISENPGLRPTDLRKRLSNDVGAERALRSMERLTNPSTTMTGLVECKFDVVMLR